MEWTLKRQLQPSVEAVLRAEPDLEGVTFESLLVNLYRQHKITKRELRESLGLSRIEIESVLHRHKVTEDLAPIEDYLRDIETLRQLRDKPIINLTRF